MPTCPVYDTTEYYLCPGDTMGYYAITIMDTGMYTYVDGMFYHTAIVREGRSYATICDTIVENQLPYSYNGYIFDDSISHYTIILQGANIHHCDSVITYSLFVYANVHTNIDTTVCPYDVPMEWNGITISDNYFDSIVIATTHGADSIISLHLTVARNLKAHIGTNRTIVSYANYCDIVLYDNSAHSVHRTWILPDATDDGATFRYCYPLDYDSVEVLLVAESELGCRDTDVCYLYLEEPTLFAPNVFTPNLSTNNRFSLSGSRIATLSVDVFNRRGVLLYHWEGLDGGWDGTSGGVLLPQEAYVWHARYTTTVNPSEVQTRTGTVVLLR